ncbi:HNH endonuclease signature motif containing protein [Pseudomonas helleri]|uniref:HNH endonuclease signature motif containing protein n=1 Tax=Pseudomonas helleri TaxID=1608996 RepID=UPI003F9A6EBB
MVIEWCLSCCSCIGLFVHCFRKCLSLFNSGSLFLMRNGNAPYVQESDQAGGRVKIEIHHKSRITDGGGVYDFDNLAAITPKRHIEIHSEEQ